MVFIFHIFCDFDTYDYLVLKSLFRDLHPCPVWKRKAIQPVYAPVARGRLYAPG